VKNCPYCNSKMISYDTKSNNEGVYCKGCGFGLEDRVVPSEKATELYNGVPVDVYNGKGKKAEIWTARFLNFSATGKCWVVCWSDRASGPFPRLANASSIRVSNNPVEPPKMPKWGRV
jgi:hypothetical protein